MKSQTDVTLTQKHIKHLVRHTNLVLPPKGKATCTSNTIEDKLYREIGIESELFGGCSLGQEPLRIKGCLTQLTKVFNLSLEL
ncbi:hypothetical protein Hanom_Chr16g01447531 [Helianthus anomalus]